MDLIVIDGSYLEGGGQIIRTAVALSALTQKPVKIINIRKKRKNKGLGHQHVSAVKAVKKLCNAEVHGLRVGSEELTFIPSKLSPKDFTIDIGTAGSISLIIQTLLPLSLGINKKFTVRIKGGTDVKRAPPIDYVKNVTLKILRDFGVLTELKVLKRGFYPEGGGQKYDIGKINNKDVVEVQKKDDIVYHKLSDVEGLNEGDIVKGTINWEHRINLMRNHTATHIINAAAQKVLGKHVWQTGSNVEPDKARLDITHYKRITRNEIKEIEKIANEIVLENIPVKSSFMDRNEAEQKYGFRIYQGGVVPGNVLRIINIEGVDVEACGGTHCENTSEVGYIKILRTERIQDGVERLEYTSGINSVKEVSAMEDILLNSSEILGVPAENLPKTVKRFFEEWKEQKKTIEELQKKMGEYKKYELANKFEKVGSYDVLVEMVEGNPKELMSIADNLVKEGSIVVLLNDNGYILCKRGDGVELSMGDLLRKIAKGGGKDNLAQGKCLDDIKTLKNKVFDELK